MNHEKCATQASLQLAQLTVILTFARSFMMRVRVCGAEVLLYLSRLLKVAVTIYKSDLCFAKQSDEQLRRLKTCLVGGVRSLVVFQAMTEFVV